MVIGHEIYLYFFKLCVFLLHLTNENVHWLHVIDFFSIIVIEKENSKVMVLLVIFLIKLNCNHKYEHISSVIPIFWL